MRHFYHPSLLIVVIYGVLGACVPRGTPTTPDVLPAQECSLLGLLSTDDPRAVARSLGSRLNWPVVMIGRGLYLCPCVEGADVAGDAELSALAGDVEEAAVAGDVEDASVAGDTEDALVAGNVEDAAIAGDTEDAVVAGDTEDAVVAGDTEDAVVAGDTEDALVAGDTEDAAVAGDSEDAVVAGDSSIVQCRRSSGQAGFEVLRARADVYLLEDGVVFRVAGDHLESLR
jgi:hypothetical protein